MTLLSKGPTNTRMTVIEFYQSCASVSLSVSCLTNATDIMQDLPHTHLNEIIDQVEDK